MALMASKVMVDSSVQGSLKNVIRRLSGASSRITKMSQLKPTDILVKSSGRVLKSTQAIPTLGKSADSKVATLQDMTSDTGGNINRLISRMFRAVSAIANNVHVQPRRDRKSLINLSNFSNQQKRTILGDQSALFTCSNGFGKSSNVNVMRTAHNWSFMRGSIRAQKVMQFRGFGENLVQNRTFSTTAKLEANGKKEGKECKKKGGGLPCLKPVGLGADDKKKGDNKVCEKFCMPCCAPARDPPTCVVAQKKRECKKLKPPRPAYSECKKDPMKNIKPCECLIQRLPPCGRSDQAQSNKNC